MNFFNNNISTEELPAIEKVIFHPLEKDYLKVARINLCIVWFLFLAVNATAFYFIKRIQLVEILYTSAAILLLLFILGWISVNQSFKNSGYALRSRDILFKRGWLIRKVRAVPLKRIQYVSLQSGPIERKFGLASISIYTAGSEEADFTIRGISKKSAQQIKEWISTQLNGETP